MAVFIKLWPYSLTLLQSTVHVRSLYGLGDIHEVRRHFLRGRGLPNTDVWWHERNQKSWIKGWRTLWTAFGSTKFLLFWGRRRTEACTVIAVVHIGGRFTFWSRILNLRIKSLWLLFGIFCQKVLETNLNFRCQRVRNQKKKDINF